MELESAFDCEQTVSSSGKRNCILTRVIFVRVNFSFPQTGRSAEAYNMIKKAIVALRHQRRRRRHIPNMCQQQMQKKMRLTTGRARDWNLVSCIFLHHFIFSLCSLQLAILMSMRMKHWLFSTLSPGMSYCSTFQMLMCAGWKEVEQQRALFDMEEVWENLY